MKEPIYCNGNILGKDVTFDDLKIGNIVNFVPENGEETITAIVTNISKDGAIFFKSITRKTVKIERGIIGVLFEKMKILPEFREEIVPIPCKPSKMYIIGSAREEDTICK